MRYLLLFITLLYAGSSSFAAADRSVDSLLIALNHTSDLATQIRIYRDLADITSETQESCNYLLKLAESAHAAKQVRPMMEALTDLATVYLQLDKTDSAKYSLSLAERYSPESECDTWCSYIRMRIFAAEMLGDQIERVVEEKTAEFQKRDIANESLYQQIEAEFVIAASLDSKDMLEESLPHFQNALKLAEKLPFREGTPYQLLLMRQISRIYNSMQKTQTASEIIKNMIGIKEKYYDLYDKDSRPFYPMDNFYITNYAGLLINIENMSAEQISFYLDKLVSLSDKSKNPAHKYNRFQAQFNYSVVRRDLNQALVYNDSLIYFARQIAAYQLPNLYRIGSILNEALGKDKAALTFLRESHRLQDSIRQSDSQAKYDKLRVEYDLNRLNYENSELANRNKHILIICLSIILLSAVIGCIYLYAHLRKEKERKEREEVLKLRAEESEKLKTAFINSICHEIRTPLNGIVGYSGLLLDSSVDEEIRSTFPAEIQRNTTELVSLIDSMLEVSHLDISDEKLPCSPVDVAQLCRTSYEQCIQKCTNPDIETQIELPDHPMTICTHERYLALVLENLMDNAYKFTEQGKITLRCHQAGNNIEIFISDTGCGIPAEKREIVFERFIKLDIYKQGGGLGLYLCRQIIRRLSGQIFIDPEYTGGTRVVVKLPFN